MYHYDASLAQLKETVHEKEEELQKLADELTAARKKAASGFCKKVSEGLSELNFLNHEFNAEFEQTGHFTSNGGDSVKFMISTNVGQGLKPLWKVASGGEVSRIMLAIKVIFSKVDNIPILIFDEIDTGVGGETVRKIANKLQEIGETTQVMSITHSPAIAAKATQQFYIEKKLLGNKTITQVKELDEDERVKEIARMLAGKNISEAVIEHAKELLGDA